MIEQLNAVAKGAAFERELEGRAAYLQEKAAGESTAITLHALDAQLANRLEAIVRDPGEWILIVEATHERYIQFLASENDRLVSECVSSEFLPPEAAWSEEAEQRISQLGGSDQNILTHRTGRSSTSVSKPLSVPRGPLPANATTRLRLPR